MSAITQKLADTISITIKSLMSINRAFICSVVGFDYFGLRFLASILPGRKAALAYCENRTGAGFLTLPLRIDDPSSYQLSLERFLRGSLLRNWFLLNLCLRKTSTLQYESIGASMGLSAEAERESNSAKADEQVAKGINTNAR